MLDIFSDFDYTLGARLILVTRIISMRATILFWPVAGSPQGPRRFLTKTARAYRP
jgi:hypothetical protein